MRDAEDSNRAAGHRRWLLYPQTKTMGTGDVPGQGAFKSANAIWVQDGGYGSARPLVRDTFVAWPPPGYVPRPLAFSRWSFAYPGANFADARVAMTLNGASLALTIDSNDAQGLGENALVWTPAFSLPKVLAQDAVFEARIENVVVGGAAKSFAYRVIVFEPNVYGPDTALPFVSGPERPTVGETALYRFAPQPGADGHEWLQASARALSYSEGAEMGADDWIAQVSDPAKLITKAVRHGGAASFHLTHGKPVAQYLELDKNLLAGANAELRFYSRLGYATGDEIAAVQLSTDGGHSWFSVYEQAGAGDARETAFVQRTVDLSAYAGRLLRARFAYTLRPRGSSYTYYGDGDPEGWNIDDIVPSDFMELPGAQTRAVPASGELAFTPNAKGVYALAVRGLIQNRYPSEWGAGKIVTAAPAAAASFALQLTKSGAGQGEVGDAASGLVCGADCAGLSRSLPAGSVLKLAAVAATGSTFAGWGGDCAGTATCNLTLDRDRRVVATFDAAPATGFSLKFEDKTDVPPKIFAYSNTVVVENLAAPQKLSISGGAYSLNGGAYAAKAGRVSNGDTLTIRVKSGGLPGAVKTATIRVGDYVAFFRAIARR